MNRFFGTFLQIIGAATLCLALGGAALFAFAGYWMEVDDPPVKSDYILPLAGDPHRLIEAARLYREGYAPVILVSNARRLPPSRLDRLQWKMGFPRYTPEQYRALLLQPLGAATAKLEPFGDGHISTAEEAEALRTHLAGKRVKLLIVTSPYHARRAKMIFENTLPDCEITVVTTEEGAFDKTWWKDRDSAEDLVLEFAKTLYYLFGGVFRSTDPAPGG